MKQFAAIILLLFISCNGARYGHLKKVKVEQKTLVVKQDVKVIQPYLIPHIASSKTSVTTESLKHKQNRKSIKNSSITTKHSISIVVNKPVGQQLQNTIAVNKSIKLNQDAGNNKYAVASFKFIILALMISLVNYWFVFWIAGGFCLISVILGIIGLKQCKANNQKGKGFALTGIIIGAIPALAFILVTIISLMLANEF